MDTTTSNKTWLSKHYFISNAFKHPMTVILESQVLETTATMKGVKEAAG